MLETVGVGHVDCSVVVSPEEMALHSGGLRVAAKMELALARR